MICEPNLNLPQLIELDSMKSLQKTSNDVEGKLKSGRSKLQIKSNVSMEQEEYNVLPLSKNQFDHLNDVLSLHSNNYLACRWNSFLDKVTENYICIRLYMDYRKSLESRVVRRKFLNGKFYDINNEIAPVPHLSDPHSSNQK